MPSSMLLMTVSSRSLWLPTSRRSPVTESAMVLNSRPNQEMVSDPALRDPFFKVPIGHQARRSLEPVEAA